MIHRLFLFACITLFGLATCDDAAEPAEAPPAETLTEPASDSMLPFGFNATLDAPDATLDDVGFVAEGRGFRVRTGPAAIFYRDADRAEGSYTLRGVFAQQSAAEHPEAYGLFFGGHDLATDSLRYVYFLVRQDGRYLIKRRAGASTETLVPWTPHEAVAGLTADAAAPARNELAVEVGADAVQFLVGGTPVHTLERAALPGTDGQAGLRVNHNLDLVVEDFGLQR